jgi:hypothetical protein
MTSMRRWNNLHLTTFRCLAVLASSAPILHACRIWAKLS